MKITYPLTVGENIITIRATDGSVAENATVQQITVNYEADESTYAGWVAANSLPTESAGPNDDPFAIGIPNLVAFALGIEPQNPDLSRLPVYEAVELEGILYHSLRFDRSSIATLVQFDLERGSNLTTWSEEANSVLESLTTTPPDSEEVRLRITDAIPANEDSQFFRLKVSAN